MKKIAPIAFLVGAAAILLIGTACVRPANAAWPMFHGDAARTGQSAVQGSPSGVLAWSYDTGSVYEYSSPVIGDNGRVYLGLLDHRIYSLTPDGSLSWSYQTGFNVRSAPAVGSDGRVYGISDDKNIYGLLSDGSLLWSYDRGPGYTYSSPAIGSDGKVYAGSGTTAATIYIFNSNGSLSWSYKTGGGDSSIAIDGNSRVFVGGTDKNIYSLLSNGSLAWSYRTGSDVRSSPAIASNGNVYVGSDDSRIYGLLSDGSLIWSHTTGAYVNSSPAISSSGRVYVGSSDTNLYGLSSSGTLVWSYEAGNIVGASPAIGSDGTVYEGSDDNRLYGFLSDGSLLWSYETGGQVYSSPAIGADGRVYVGSDDDRLYVFEGPPTPVPNYINLAAGPAFVSPGSTVTLVWTADFGTWSYSGVPVDVYLAAIKDPKVIDGPSSTADALSGGTVFLAGRKLSEWYPYQGSVKEPTWSGIAFPPAPISGSTSLTVPANPALAGDWVFGTAFIRRDTGQFVRDDGKPVENSNAFAVTGP